MMKKMCLLFCLLFSIQQSQSGVLLVLSCYDKIKVFKDADKTCENKWMPYVMGSIVAGVFVSPLFFQQYLIGGAFVVLSEDSQNQNLSEMLETKLPYLATEHLDRLTLSLQTKIELAKNKLNNEKFHVITLDKAIVDKIIGDNEYHAAEKEEIYQYLVHR